MKRKMLWRRLFRSSQDGCARILNHVEVHATLPCIEHLESRQLLSVSAALVAPGITPIRMVQIGKVAVFIKGDDASGYQLWETDGTSAGTKLLNDINPGSMTYFEGMVRSGNSVYFLTDSAGSSGLWRTDGTAVGTTEVAATTNASDLVATSDGRLYFDDEVMTGAFDRYVVLASDGTASGTFQIAASVDPPALTTAGRYLIFSVDDIHGGGGYGVFRYGMTSGGGIENGAGDIVSAGINAYYTVVKTSSAFPPQTTSRLVVFDGNTGNSATLPPDSMDVVALFPVAPAADGALYYYVGTTDAELWFTDGTAAGSHEVVQLGQGTIYNPVGVGKSLFYTYDDGVHGEELWTSDGSAAGTHMVVDLTPGAAGSSLANFTAVGNELFFTDTTAGQGTRLYMSDGTAAGTLLVPGQPIGANDPAVHYLQAVGTTLYFNATDAQHGLGLWKVDTASTISGVVFNDANGNGIQDGSEAGMPGVTVFIDSNGNGLLDPGESSTVTGQDGAFSLSASALADSVHVVIVKPSGGHVTSPIGGYYVLTIEGGQDSSGLDFGIATRLPYRPGHRPLPRMAAVPAPAGASGSIAQV